MQAAEAAVLQPTGFEIDGYYFEKAQQRICQEQAYMTVYDFI